MKGLLCAWWAGPDTAVGWRGFLAEAGCRPGTGREGQGEGAWFRFPFQLIQVVKMSFTAAGLGFAVVPSFQDVLSSGKVSSGSYQWFCKNKSCYSKPTCMSFEILVLQGIRCFFIREWESLCRPLSAGFALVVLRCAGNRCRDWRAVCQVYIALQHTYIKLLCNFGNLIQNTKYQVTGCGVQFTQLLYFSLILRAICRHLPWGELCDVQYTCAHPDKQ